MRKLSLQNKVCILLSWALMSMHSGAEQEYFFESTELSWDEARTHCQICYKELVTLTPGNIQTVAQKLANDSWIGLRQNVPSASKSTNVPWSRWANEDPLTFQNWYPGFKRSHVGDSCVAMLSFGAWVEKNCSDPLPFICYDDRFVGRASVTNVTSGSAVLSWLPVPANISHHRVEVVGGEPRDENQDILTTDLSDLMAGTRYSVQVFPVKCGRDLNPQEVTFYTKPNKVNNLTVTNVTVTSVSLRWGKPVGNVSMYIIDVHGNESQSVEPETEVRYLTPGSSYKFVVFTVVEGKPEPIRSEGLSITTFTKPLPVSSLSVSENTMDSLLLSWSPPEGRATDFWVQATDDSKGVLFSKTVKRSGSQTWQEVRVTGLPMGTRITLGVRSLANGTLGDEVIVVNYTVPAPVSHLNLSASHHYLNASWTVLAGNYSSFTVLLRLEGETVETTSNLTEPRKQFLQLRTGAKYTVIVHIVSGKILGPAVNESKFTLPLPPTDASVFARSKTRLTFQWVAPESALSPRYQVRLSSRFWGHSLSAFVGNRTSHTFENLKSGTRYELEVRTVTDEEWSEPLTMSNFTVAEERQLSLSMLCSSPQLLQCAKKTTKDHVFSQLKERFKDLLGSDIVWNLEMQESENV
ncbi:receptor-type tyrosine-protein phosphatase eta [Scophthalmus maximus]|uniref:receptor-type tyrosine-protein phosphatase eta n=1 Tax=Scophthalmus maximus TaxID=52904 RepID=UPI001FA91AD1|nr:receptor-type tyrosine-protein phosphatase eta [Scophthalmus maximus]XP_035472262.2 receptor-type tyrosine-protein phosphatase eta [Scophthalmus maximus]